MVIRQVTTRVVYFLVGMVVPHGVGRAAGDLKGIFFSSMQIQLILEDKDLEEKHFIPK
jgi:hypothetical protein